MWFHHRHGRKELVVGQEPIVTLSQNPEASNGIP